MKMYYFSMHHFPAQPLRAKETIKKQMVILSPRARRLFYIDK